MVLLLVQVVSTNTFACSLIQLIMFVLPTLIYFCSAHAFLLPSIEILDHKLKHVR